MSLASHVTVSVTTPPDPRVLRVMVQVVPHLPPLPSTYERIREATRGLRFRAHDFPIDSITLRVDSMSWQWFLTATPVDRTSSAHKIPITYGGAGGSHFAIERARLPVRQILVAGLRETIRGWLLHEVDECLLDGDERPFDPHREGLPAETMVKGRLT